MNIAVLIASTFALISSPIAPTAKPAATPLSGDYVEARTASVFAGACHINGEMMATGRDALMAWQFDNGIRVMAVVSSTDNLANASAPRQSEIVIDASAGPKKAQLALNSILSHDKSLLGTIKSVRHEKISFSHADREYQVRCPGFGSLDIQGMPNDECCKQPNQVWYEPLVKLDHRKVGYTVDAAYTAGAVGDSWQREDENGAFYGAFAY